MATEIEMKLGVPNADILHKVLEDPELIRMAWENFHENQQVPYVSPLPLDLKPDFT